MHDHEPRSLHGMARHYLGDLVYGANDGIITTFAVVAGVTGASLPARTILILGFANLLADGFSMGASNVLAIRSGEAMRASDGLGVEEPRLAALLEQVNQGLAAQNHSKDTGARAR